MGIPLKLDPDKRSHELYDDLDYKEFWTGWQQRKLDQAERVVVQRLLPASGRRLIDLGCGYGRLSTCYLDRFEQVVMFDGSPAFLQEARQKIGGRAIYIAGDVNRLPFRRGAFDSILMVRVLHHIADAKRCLSELHRILAAGGRLIFTYRNKLYLMNILRWLMRPGNNRLFSLDPADVGTTLISHHPEDIARMLRQAGFTRVRSRGLGLLDRTANLIKPYGRFAPTGAGLAPFFGWLKLAPWIFCSADASGQAELIEGEGPESILTCLRCGGDVDKGEGEYRCPTCASRYPITNGILDFRPQEGM